MQIKNIYFGAIRARYDMLAIVAVALFVLALVATPLFAEPGNDNRAPELTGDAEKLEAEAGNKVAFHAYAEGVQIYRWTGTAWAFVGPEAVLYATDNAGGAGVIGIHYAGPTWESAGGSKVVGQVVDRCTPDPDAIDWLLLRGASSGGPGIFNGVTFIQRINTVGGKAPTAAGEFVGQVVRVPYTADYFFYRKQG